MVKKVIQQWGKHEKDWQLTIFERVLLTVKTLIAIALRLEEDGEVDIYSGHYVTIAMLDGGTYSCEFGTCGWFEAIMISKGWRNWRYVIMQDGWP